MKAFLLSLLVAGVTIILFVLCVLFWKARKVEISREISLPGNITGISITEHLQCDDGKIVVFDKDMKKSMCAYPPLKMLLDQLDAVTCRMHLQYSINNLYRDGEKESHFVGFAWPEHMEFREVSIIGEGVPYYIANGYPVRFKTKEGAIIELLKVLSSGDPNTLPFEHGKENRPPLERPIEGPKHCKRALSETH
jgi:hypothetical protein